MPKHRYLHLDVFTDQAFTGNQLAVFPDGRDIDGALMQRIANEMAFSETTFVLPADDAGTDARMRIFTPLRELPIAGHPTVGTTFALAHEGVIEAGRDRFVFGLGVGPTSVTLEWDGDRLAFAWMRQPVPEFGPALHDVAAVAAALGVDAADIAATGLPPERASAGLPILFVPLASRAAVDRAWLDAARMGAVFEGAGMEPTAVFVFTQEPGSDGATAYSRMFAPMFGIPEDPATGGASGPLGCYLLRHGAVSRNAARALLSLQGAKMGRPSRIHMDVASDADGAVTQVRVGGRAVLVAEGTLLV